MTVHVGTCGWQYRDWRGCLYPEKLRQADWLEHYAARFHTVEVDNTFYRLPAAETFAAWRQRTPRDFCMALKTSRFLTHVKRLRDPREPVHPYMEHASKLGDKLGPLLVQLPPTSKAEPRHESWFSDATQAVLQDRRVALCLPDTREELVGPWWRTAPWTYVRFHVPSSTCTSTTTRAAARCATHAASPMPRGMPG